MPGLGRVEFEGIPTSHLITQSVTFLRDMKYHGVFEALFCRTMLRAISAKQGGCWWNFLPQSSTDSPTTRAFWESNYACFYLFFFFFKNWGELSPLHCCGDSINETDRWGQVRGGDSSWLPSYFCDPSLQKPAVMPGRLSKTDIQQWQIGHLNMTLDVPKPQLKLCQLFSVVYHRGRITVLEIGCVRSVSVSANEHLWPWKRSAEQWDDVVAVSFQ